MAEPKPFSLVKLICSIISSRDDYFAKAEDALVSLYGLIDLKSPFFPFNLTEYYEKQMGKGLRRIFLTFARLVPPEKLSEFKLQTNSLEEKIKESFRADFRVVNLDPGILTGSALVMATAKDFAHRIPLASGIYAHLELLFSKTAVRILDWTYPDFKQEAYQGFFLEVRRIYLEQLRHPARD